MDQPTPFTIVRNKGEPPVASNGLLRMVALDGGEIRLRRGIRASTAPPVAERIVPHLNALCGELVKPGCPLQPQDIAAHLHVLQMACVPPQQENIEWAFVELNGVRVYTDGKTVVVTTQDLPVG